MESREYKDHVGLAFDAFGLLMHHVEKLQALVTDPDDQTEIGSLVAPLGRLHAVLSGLHYKHHED